MKKFFLKHQNLILLFLSLLMITSYFLGIFLNEVHGASDLDAKTHTWPAIIEFSKFDTIDVLKYYYKFGENSYPLHHIIYGKLFNIENTEEVKIISSFVSLFIPILFFIALKNNLKFNSIFFFIFFSSIIFLSPYFRSSAIWGLTENTGYFFLIISILFFQKFIEKRTINYLFLVCLFSSLALYARPQLIFFSIFFYLILILSKKNNEIILGTIFYILFAIPGILIAYCWGGLIVEESGTKNLAYFVNYKSIPNSFMTILSLMLVYLTPFYISCQKNIFNEISIKKNIFLFLKCISFIFLIYFVFKVDFSYLSFDNNRIYGQGFLIDLIFRATGSEFLILPFIALGLFIIIFLSSLSKKNFLLISIITIIFSLRVHFFTEYFDPLLYIVIFLIFDFNKIFYQNIKKIKFQLFFLFYYLGILSGAIFF